MLIRSPNFPSQSFEEEFAKWLEANHPGETVSITGYYVPYEGGVVVYFETD